MAHKAMKFRQHWKICMMLLCIAALSQSSWGTAVLVLIHGKEIWIAADSLQVSSDGQYHRSVCKIINEGTFYFAAASPHYKDGKTGFSIEKLADSLRNKKATLKEIADAFIAASQTPMSEELAFISRTEPLGEYAIAPDNIGIRFAQAIFFRVEKHKPEVLSLLMTFKKTKDGWMTLYDPIGPPQSNDGWAAGIGETEVATNFISQNYFKRKGNIVGLLRDSIALEATKVNLVGGEPTILKLSSDGVEWIEKGLCQ